ncbi:MAG: glycoside hydrolase, partial [Sphingobacteriaceae bacterium]
GGTVLVSGGRFLTGTVLLKSNITLYLVSEATIIATDDLTQFKGSMLRPEDPERPVNINTKDIFAWTRALILLDNVNNVTITGTGTIDGALVPKPKRAVHGILAAGANNIDINSITITRAGNWSIVGLYVEDFKVTNVTVTDGYDGIHVRRGKNLVIDNCKLYCRDDAIAGGYWENTVISNCSINSACNGIRLVLPATNLEIKDCDIVGPGVFGHFRGTVNKPLVNDLITGIILQPGAWGIGKGGLDKVYIHDIKIKDAQTALTYVLNEGNTANDILTENVVATGIYQNACSVEAWPNGSTYQNIRFKNISVSYKIASPNFVKVKSFERPATESRPLPYWGFYIRGVKNIAFENIKMDYEGLEERPFMGFDKVENVLLKNVSYKNVPGVNPLKYTGETEIKTDNFKPL